MIDTRWGASAWAAFPWPPALTADQARSSRTLNACVLVDIALRGGVTLHLSDRNVESGQYRYEAYLIDAPATREQLERADSTGTNADVELQVRNDRYGSYTYLSQCLDSYPMTGGTVTITDAWLSPWGELMATEVLFVGTADEPREITRQGFRCTISSRECAADLGG